MFCDVGNDVLGVWLVKPDDVSTSVMFRFAFPGLRIAQYDGMISINF